MSTGLVLKHSKRQRSICVGVFAQMDVFYSGGRGGNNDSYGSQPFGTERVDGSLDFANPCRLGPLV